MDCSNARISNHAPWYIPLPPQVVKAKIDEMKLGEFSDVYVSHPKPRAFLFLLHAAPLRNKPTASRVQLPCPGKLHGLAAWAA